MATTTEKKLDKATVSNPSGKYHYGLGRRKTAVAKVRLYPGKGVVVVNDREEADFFGGLSGLIRRISAPLALTGFKAKYDISAKVNGGGIVSQADAILLGVSRALVAMDPELKAPLRKNGFLTRDPREKERKKPGLRRARKAPQFSKR